MALSIAAAELMHLAARLRKHANRHKHLLEVADRLDAVAVMPIATTADLTHLCRDARDLADLYDAAEYH